MNTTIIEALRFRYAVQIFDPNKKISPHDLETILESARLAPSSLGVEPWKFIVVENQEIREKLQIAGSGQPKITQASHLIVIAYRTDYENIIRERLERTAQTQHEPIENLSGLQKSLETGITKKVTDDTYESWAKSQTYIPLGIMMETASLLKIDNAAMEGFDNAEVDRILNLQDQNLKVATMLALGYRGEDPVAHRPKTRRAFEEVVEFRK